MTEVREDIWLSDSACNAGSGFAEVTDRIWGDAQLQGWDYA